MRFDMIFDKYLDKVIDQQDLILFKDAIKSANNNIYRGAFILAWLSGVESLKRRFKECGKQDQKANDIYAQIIQLEKKHKAVDESILERAKNYGFLNELEHAKLEQLYQLRSVFAHPYNAAPSQLELENEISLIVDIILSRPALLSETFIDNLIEKLTNDACYLNDFENTVKEETQKWVTKINPSCYKYFIEKYIEQAEQICKNKNMQLFINRAKWALEEFIKLVGYNIYNANEWHDFIANYPCFSAFLAFRNTDFFLNIGIRGQDYLVNKVLELSVSDPTWLGVVLPFLDSENILRENKTKILNLINTLPPSSLKFARIPFKYYYGQVIKELETGDFYRQNPVISLLEENETSLNELDLNIQRRLGYLVHSAYDNNSWNAKDYISKIINQPQNYPINFLFGICDFLVYSNSVNTYSFIRQDALKVIGTLINNSNNDIKQQLIDTTNNLINDYFLNQEDMTFDEIKKYLFTDKYSWISINETDSTNE